jgi:RNA polymerase sigma-70 factor (ECF subfamily)
VTQNDADWLAARFEEHRPRLRSVALRMLGSPAEADDAVQEAWLRFSQADTAGVENLGGWLTTVVSRVCLNALNARRVRQAQPIDEDVTDDGLGPAELSGPEQEALLADSIGVALLVVLDNLTPAERVAFVLHDMFAVPFDDISAIVGRSPAATRQLASRARRRVQGLGPVTETEGIRHAQLVDAFLKAARGGDFSSLLALLDPDVVMRADEAAVILGAPAETRGAQKVAGFLRRARGALPALVDGVPAAVWMPQGELRVVYRFTVDQDHIVGVDLLADPDRLSELDLAIGEAP